MSSNGTEEGETEVKGRWKFETLINE